MADKFGYKKGARGIDGNDGEGWENMNRSKAAESAMYGRCWGDGGKGDITGESGMGTHGGGADMRGGKLAKSAVGGKRSIGGRGGRGGLGVHK
jgi:hypothetical protein